MRRSARQITTVCGCTPLDARHHQYGRVQHRQGALDLGDEIRVARCVHQVDGQVVDREGGHGRPDGDAALAFQLHRIGTGGARVDAAGFGDDARFEEQALGQAGLAGVNMGDDPEVQERQRATPR
jgi:hypothetical protein